VITIIKQVPALPPKHLLSPCETISTEVKTNSDLLRFSIKAHNALVMCNLDKAALNKWISQHEQ
jgi:hypothetical protein